MPDTTIRMLAKQKPMIVLNREVRGVPSVVPDNARGGRRLVEHLAGLGHESVVYVRGPEASWADGARLRAVRESAHELSVGAHQIGPFAPTVAGGMEAVAQLVEHDATAVIAYNDLMAIGVLLGLRDLGFAVPADVSVAAFDNIFVSALVQPPLTTIAAPLPHMGRTAVRALMAMIGGTGPHVERGFVLPVRLVVRGSTGQRRRKRISPAFGTTSVSGSDSSAARLTSAGSR
jgi:LacI family transcriptional regulator